MEVAGLVNAVGYRRQWKKDAVWWSDKYRVVSEKKR